MGIEEDNNLLLVYLECISKDAESAKTGALQTLWAVCRDWFNDPALIIEQRYSVK